MNWLRYSGIWVTLVCNPYYWRVSFRNESDSAWPDTKEYVLQLVFVSVRVVVDNGQY